MLQELELQENYPSDFDMEYFKTLPSYKSRLEYANNKLTKLGSGSSRTVYAIDDKKVLKVAKNAKGIAQNEKEYDLGHNDYYIQDLVADVFDAHPQYQWIEMQRAYKVNKQTFKKITGVDIDDMGRYLLDRYDIEKRRRRGYSQSVEIVDEMHNNEFVANIFDIMMSYNMPPGDLSKLSSYGVIDNNIILVDFGFNEDIAKSHYGFKESKDPIRNMIRKEIFNLLELKTNNNETWTQTKIDYYKKHLSQNPTKFKYALNVLKTIENNKGKVSDKQKIMIQKAMRGESGNIDLSSKN